MYFSEDMLHSCLKILLRRASASAVSTSGRRTRGTRYSRSLTAVPSVQAQANELVVPCDKDDLLNGPDPTQHCQNLELDTSVTALENWVNKLDISHHFPSIPEIGNLATLVPKYVYYCEASSHRFSANYLNTG